MEVVNFNQSESGYTDENAVINFYSIAIFITFRLGIQKKITPSLKMYSSVPELHLENHYVKAPHVF